MSERRPTSEQLARLVVRPPFHDERGRKGWLERFSRPQPHVVRRHELTIAGWPRLRRPMRIVFLSDFHVGSHAGDIARFTAIAAEASALAPDLVLFGGDYVNMQMFGGGRVPPRVTAKILSRIQARYGRFAILGNHDYTYGATEVAETLVVHGIPVLDHERRMVMLGDHAIDILGIPDAHVVRPQAHALLAGLAAPRPSIVLAHDPVWFKLVPGGPFLTLAGHTHGGQIRLPLIGALKNGSHAPLRWSRGLTVDRGRHLYVSAGLGTSGVPVRLFAPPEFAVLDVNGT